MDVPTPDVVAVGTTPPTSQTPRSSAPDQLDAFISYSRRDRAFVGVLAAARESAER